MLAVLRRTYLSRERSSATARPDYVNILLSDAIDPHADVDVGINTARLFMNSVGQVVASSVQPASLDATNILTAIKAPTVYVDPLATPAKIGTFSPIPNSVTDAVSDAVTYEKPHTHDIDFDFIRQDSTSHSQPLSTQPTAGVTQEPSPPGASTSAKTPEMYPIPYPARYPNPNPTPAQPQPIPNLSPTQPQYPNLKP